jgi:hypothetical protein
MKKSKVVVVRFDQHSWTLLWLFVVHGSCLIRFVFSTVALFIVQNLTALQATAEHTREPCFIP